MTIRPERGRHTGAGSWWARLFGQTVPEPLLSRPEPVWNEPEAGYQCEVAMPLPSRDDHLTFTARMRLYVRTDETASRDSNAVHIGKLGLRHRAMAMTRRRSLSATEQLRDELELSLNSWLKVNDSGVASRASGVVVTANEDDVAVVQGYENAMRLRKLTELSTTVDRQEIAYFSELLSDPRQATAWWFHKNSANVDKLPQVAQTFRDITGRLRDVGDEPERAEAVEFDTPGAVIDDVATMTDAPSWAMLHRYVTRFLQQHDPEGELLKRWQTWETTVEREPVPDAQDS